MASAHMPLKRAKQSVPHSAYAWSTTSVSQLVWNVWPSGSSSARSSRKL